MGDKTRKSQRTKNNARPSSSGRSAELLTSVNPNSGLVNIMGTQLPALFPSLVAPTVDLLIKPKQLQMCFKQLTKKDPITKAKVLRLLSGLVTDINMDDVVSALPSWTHFYKILTADPDCKVRGCTQACHGVIARVCGRNLAPHLKQLMAPWLQAQYDEHAPAQAHAHRSLQNTFPDSRLPEALSFCKDEILTHSLDILVGNGESVHIRETDSEEERVLRAGLIVAGSLNQLHYLSRHLPATDDACLWAGAERLLQDAAFWKRATSADPRIRAAWFRAVGALVARFQTRFGSAYGARALRELVASRELNPLAAAQLWETLLIFMHNIQDWHQYLEKKDLLSKRILDALESGGWGDARQLSDALLPMLASLPESVFTKDFCNAFFKALFCGTYQKPILSSKGDRQLWLTSLEECLRYLSTQRQDYVLEIVTSAHRTWLEKVLTDAEGQTRIHMIKYSANRMTNLVKYWLKQSKEGNSEKYDQLIRNFWQNIGSTLTSQIDRLPPSRDRVDALVDAHVTLLGSLNSSFKKQHSVKFQVDCQAVEEKSPVQTQQCEPSIIERYNHNLNELVQIICGHYFEFANTRQISDPVLSPLITLLVDFDSEALFSGIASQCNSDSLYAFYETVLRSWLTGDTMRCKAVVDIVFMMMRHMSEEEQDATFDTFKQFPPGVVEWCISLSLSHPHCTAPAVRRWLRSGMEESPLLAICSRLLETGDSSAKNLLMMCLNADANGESIVSPVTVSKALDLISASLYELDSPTLEARSSCAAALASTLAPHAPLLTALLNLTVATQPGSSRLSLETWREVRDAWRDGLAALSAPLRARFSVHAGALLHAHSNILQPASPITRREPSSDSNESSTELNITKMEHVVSLCPYLVFTRADDALDIPEVIRFTKTMLDIAPTDPLRVEAFATTHEILAHELNCPCEGDSDIITAITSEGLPELCKEELVAHLNKCSFRLMYLRTVFLNQPDDELENNWCNELLSDEYFQLQFCQTIYDYAVICSLYDGYAFWPHYKLIEQSKNRFGAFLSDIIIQISIENKRKILNCLSELAATKGFFWSYARRYFEVQVKLDAGDQIEVESGQVATANSRAETVQTEEEINVDDGSSETVTDKHIAESTSEDTSGKIETPYVTEDWSSLVTGSGFFHTLQVDSKNSKDRAAVVRTKYLLALRSLRAAHASEPALAAWLSSRAAHPDLFLDAYYEHNHIMLFEMEVSSAAWAQVVSNAAICSYLTAVVPDRGWTAHSHQWDFTNITLCSLLTSVELSKTFWGTTKVALLASNVLRLFCAVAPFIHSIPERCLKSQPSEHVASLPAEWADIYAPDLYKNLNSILVFVLDASETTEVNSNHVSVISALVECARCMRPAAAERRLVDACTGALARPAHPAFKYLAHAALAAMLEPLLLEDAEKLESWSNDTDQEEDSERPPLQLSLHYYSTALSHLRQLVETALEHVRVCAEVCSLEPFTDAHSMTLGWLLLCDIRSQQCILARARGDLMSQYIQIYREQQCTEALVRTALRLLPEPLLTAVQTNIAAHSTTALADYEHMFTTAPDIDVYKWCGGEVISHAACRCVWGEVRGAGAAAARSWRGAAPHRHGALLDNITARYITPHVVKEEFALLQKRSSELNDVEMSINRSSAEVECVVRTDGKGVSLRVELATDHPLGLPRLSAPHDAAGNINWILKYLSFQNGTILDALRIWSRIVTNKLERTSQCYICYCRLHHITGRLPTVHCRTCNNKFHNKCLRKWFQTSNKTTCPLCRASF